MADSAVQYATSEDKYPVVQVTRTKNDNLGYKLYDGQLLFYNKTGNEKLYIGNGKTPVNKISEYPFFQAGDWKSITGAITKISNNGTYVLSTDAVVNALPFVTKDDDGHYVLGSSAGDSNNFISKIHTTNLFTNSIKLQNSPLFEIKANTNKIAEIVLGNYDKITLPSERYYRYYNVQSEEDKSAMLMGGADSTNIGSYVYTSDQYVLFKGNSNGYDFASNPANFYDSINLGIFVTWTEYVWSIKDSSERYNNTFANCYTQFIPKILLSELTNSDTALSKRAVTIKYSQDNVEKTTSGIGVTSGLMLSVSGGKAASKYLYVTPVGIFGHKQNSENRTDDSNVQIDTDGNANTIEGSTTTPNSSVNLVNRDWVLKYVTVI